MVPDVRASTEEFEEDPVQTAGTNAINRMKYITENRFMWKWRNWRMSINITLKCLKVIPCDNLTLPRMFP